MSCHWFLNSAVSLMYWKISRRSKSSGFSTRMPQNGGCGIFGAAGISMLGSVGAAASTDTGSRGSRELLHHPPFGDALLARAVRRRQIFHQVQPGEGVVGVENAAVVFAAQIVFDVLAGQRRAAADHREIQLLVMQVLDDVLHLQRRLHQQAAQADGVGLLLHAQL